MSASISEDSKSDNFECQACERSYKQQSNLKRHLKSSRICQMWIEQQIEQKQNKPEYIPNSCDIIQNNYNKVELNLSFNTGENQCKICGKKYSNKSNLNKHIKKSVICEKWNKLADVILSKDLNEDSKNRIKYSERMLQNITLSNGDPDYRETQLPYNPGTLSHEQLHSKVNFGQSSEQVLSTNVSMNYAKTDPYDEFEAPKDNLIKIICNLYI